MVPSSNVSMGLFASSSFTGVDVGASSVKVIGGQLGSKAFSIKNLAIAPVAPRSIDERGIVNRDAVLQSLMAATNAFGTKPGTVATSICGLGVLTKRITIPKIPKKEIPDQVKWEAEQVFPTDVSTIVTDYVLIGEGKQVPGAPVGTKGWDILLIGVRADEVSILKDAVTEAKFKLKVIDLHALVVSSFLGRLLGFSTKSTVAYVDVGATTTRVIVCDRGNVIFIREFVTAGNAFTDSIAQRLGLSFEDAESLKIQDGSAYPQEAMDALKGQVAYWKNDLQQSEDIFVAQEQELLIEKWCVFGGGSLTPGLMDALKDERFGPKLIYIPYNDIFKVKNKKIDPQLVAGWGPRLITAAALSSRSK